MSNADKKEKRSQMLLKRRPLVAFKSFRREGVGREARCRGADS